MDRSTALLLRGLLIATFVAATAGLIGHATGAADVQAATPHVQSEASVSAFDSTPQTPVDDTPITPRESVGAFDRD